MNSKLYGKTYKVPTDIINDIKKKLMMFGLDNGAKRGKNIVKDEHISYSMMKRILHDMASMDEKEFALCGGIPMKNFIEKTLNSERKGTEIKNNIDPLYKTRN